METYKEFLDRINSFEKKELNLGCTDFCVNPGLLKKVDSNNNFSKFYGDTVVFDLDINTKAKITDTVEQLYKYCPECFCEKLKSDTFHITLHDLNNSPNLSDVATDVFKNEIQLSQKLKHNPIQKHTIKMKSNNVFNMVNTSIVLGFYPVDEVEYEKLMNLYNYIDEIKVLPYPLTPHITLAYYNRDGFSKKSSKELERIVNKFNESNFEIEISTENLIYQKFSDMNNYINIFRF